LSGIALGGAGYPIILPSAADRRNIPPFAFVVGAHRETIMGRMSIDCRQYPSESNCSVAISADTKKELVDAAVQHAVAVHGHQDGPELREQIGGMIKDGG
jgi:predicted small metal-binding protein